MNSDRTVVLLQPYVPGYRVPLFDTLSKALADSKLRLIIAHGAPTGDQADRDDAIVSAPWSFPVRVKQVRAGAGVTFTWKHVGEITKTTEAVICELATSELTTWRQLIVRPNRVALWGHGASFVTARRGLEESLEVQFARRAAHTMTYTESGRASLVARGVSSATVTAVGNSTDTRHLRELVASRAPDRAAELRAALRLPAHCALFVGGLDNAKRIPFLVSAARIAHEQDRDFVLVVGGSGAAASDVDTVREEPWIRWLPRMTSEDLAAVSLFAECIWMPGRVGLVAVDALALRLPVLTTDFPFHAPEFDYLVKGTDVFVLPNDPPAFAAEARKLTAGWRSAGRPASLTPVPSVEDVAGRMAAVILQVARSGSRR